MKLKKKIKILKDNKEGAMRAKIVYIIIFIILSNSICFAYDNKITHFDLSGHSASFSLLAETDLLKEYGFNKNINSETNGKKIKYWVSYGADLEDAGSDFEAILGEHYPFMAPT
jgi:hypothetical protein